MSKKIILFLIVASFFSRFSFARAEVVINEIELSPTAERFLELYNESDVAVDLTDWYMQRKTANGSSFDSLVSSTNFKGKTIDAHGYFVISKNPLNNSNIVFNSLTLTESNAIQLKNLNGDVVDKVGWGSSLDCAGLCPPNPSEGQSIQRTESGSWVVATPTPGVENEATNISSAEISSSGSAVISTGAVAETKSKTIEEQKIKVQIIAKPVALVGLPVTFEGITTGISGEKINYGKYFWNFGDGDSKEVSINGMGSLQKFTHTYFYSGEYEVSLEYYMNYYGNIPDASSKMTVKAVGADVSISSVGDANDFYVELTNNTGYDADISNWVLKSDTKSFSFPRNTILKSKKKIMISSQITNLSISDKNSLKLMTGQGKIVFDYRASVFTPAIILSSSKKVVPKVATLVSDVPVIIPSKVQVQDLSASTSASLDGSASAVSSDTGKSNGVRTYILTTIFTVFLGMSAGSVYYIRQKKVVHNAGDDFKILDE